MWLRDGCVDVLRGRCCSSPVPSCWGSEHGYSLGVASLLLALNPAPGGGRLSLIRLVSLGEESLYLGPTLEDLVDTGKFLCRVFHWGGFCSQVSKGGPWSPEAGAGPCAIPGAPVTEDWLHSSCSVDSGARRRKLSFGDEQSHLWVAPSDLCLRQCVDTL